MSVVEFRFSMIVFVKVFILGGGVYFGRRVILRGVF